MLLPSGAKQKVSLPAAYNEFARDLETQMATAISGGFVHTEGKAPAQILKDAYDFAVRNNPEIQSILQARGQTTQSAAATAPAAQAVKPVRSAKPSLGGGNTSATPKKKYKDIKDAARDAYDELFGNG